MKKISNYQIKINKKKCISCGTCTILASKTFKQEGKLPAKVLPKPHNKFQDIQLACESCPVRAISIK